jgi:serine/threonine-protein kinase
MAADKSSPDEPHTVFQPGQAGEPTPPAPPAGQSVPSSGAQTDFAPQNASPPAPMRAADGRIQVGDVLNHIFEVKRFLARGGMGEVFEGINVSSDERVAIKVMLPALAADPSVQAMFRKEARTLTRLNHAALVQYRVLAQEPQLGVLYIVTEFIDGSNLSHVMSTIKATPADLRALMRRLADGLRIAHQLGAIHRDISPDNVLLEGGRLDRAKIIDFGIAKDLDPSTKTIIGDGFAGKLNYVAPEQLGDFGREVGPWSDVYSLGLVILAVAQGRDVDMGATLVDAVDRRRSGPDLSVAPAEIKPVLERMLTADPMKRLRSMDEVIAALDSPTGAPVAAPALAQTPKRPVRVEGPPIADAPASGSTMRWVAIGGAAALVVAAGGGYLAFGGKGGTEQATTAAGGAPMSLARARATVQSALPEIPCSWLNVMQLTQDGGGVNLTVSGVAGDAAAAQGTLSRKLANSGIQVVSINFDQVSPVSGAVCQPLEAFSKFRSPENDQIETTQPKFELSKQPDGRTAAKAVATINIGPAGSGFMLLGIEPTGKVETIAIPGGVAADTRANFLKLVNELPANFVKERADEYRAIIDVDHVGISGMVVLSGREPFDSALLNAPVEKRGPDWQQRIVDEAQKGGWKSQMVWFRAVDEVPG